MSISPNRRALLGAIGIAPIAIATAAAPAKGAVSFASDRSAWDRAFAHMEATRKAERDHEPIHDAAWDAWCRNEPTADHIDLRPVRFIASIAQREDVLRTADLFKLHAEYVASYQKTWFAPDPAANIARHKATCDQIAEYRRDYAAARAKYWPELDRGNDLSEAAYEASWALFDLPAPDLAALHWKITHLFKGVLEEGCDSSTSWNAQIVEQLMADVRRLMPEAA